MIVLLPFSKSELAATDSPPGSIEEVMFAGGYPPVHDRALDPGTWYANYVATYIERDVRQLVTVRDLTTFDRFLRMCAARCGQIVNLSGLATDCGISHNTARSWLSVLEASYVVRPLSPHFRNFSRRLIKSPKLYFLDPGLAAWLLEIRTPSQLSSHAMRGPLFETWVYSELLKGAYNNGRQPNLYFWRDRAGTEIDFIADHGDRLTPIEAKSGATFASDWLAPLSRWSKLAGDLAAPAWLVYGGDTSATRKGAQTLAWKDIDTLVEGVTHQP